MALTGCTHVPIFDQKDQSNGAVPDPNNNNFKELLLGTIEEFNRSSVNSPSILVGEGEDMSLVGAPTADNKAKERSATVLLGILEQEVRAITESIKHGTRDSKGPYLKRNFPLPFNLYPGSNLGKFTSAGDSPVDWYENPDSELANCSIANLQWPKGLSEKSPQTFLYVSCAEARFKDNSYYQDGSYWKEILHDGGYYWAVYANFPEGAGSKLTLGGSSLFYYQLTSDSTTNPYWFTLAGFSKNDPTHPGWLQPANKKNGGTIGASVVAVPSGTVSVYSHIDFFEDENCNLVSYEHGEAYSRSFDPNTDHFTNPRVKLDQEPPRNEGVYCQSLSEEGAYSMAWNENSTSSIKSDFEFLSRRLPKRSKVEMSSKDPNKFFDESSGDIFSQ